MQVELNVKKNKETQGGYKKKTDDFTLKPRSKMKRKTMRITTGEEAYEKFNFVGDSLSSGEDTNSGKYNLIYFKIYRK